MSIDLDDLRAVNVKTISNRQKEVKFKTDDTGIINSIQSLWFQSYGVLVLNGCDYRVDKHHIDNGKVELTITEI